MVSIRFRLLVDDFDDFTPLVVTAIRASAVRHFGLAAVGTIGDVVGL
jgi:hypothetical protein